MEKHIMFIHNLQMPVHSSCLYEKNRSYLLRGSDNLLSLSDLEWLVLEL